MDSYRTDPALKGRMDEIKRHKVAFDFENLAFSGGGVKMIAYAGAVKVLEEVGIAQKIKRYAGTSGGSIAAALLATDHSADEMRDMADLDMKNLMKDNWFGNISTFANKWLKLGAHRVDKFYEKIREIMKNKTDNPDITFKGVYEKYGKELCIVATNVTTSSPEYFHPKTTPDVSVATAVRYSFPIPGSMQPSKIEFQSGLKQMYVDGGLLENYPIRAFDGWYLSMDANDGFLSKFAENKFRFQTTEAQNPKTLGIVLYTLWDNEQFKGPLMERREKGMVDHQQMKAEMESINTNLARTRQNEMLDSYEKYGEKTRKVQLRQEFLALLRRSNRARIKPNQFSLIDLEAAYVQLEKEDRIKDLFPENVTIEHLKKAFEKTPTEITFTDLDDFLQTKHINWMQLIDGGTPFPPENVTDSHGTIISASMAMSSRVHAKESDLMRTIGIFTGYIKTTDLKLEREDQDYLVKEGQRGTIEYLEYLLERHEEFLIPWHQGSNTSPRRAMFEHEFKSFAVVREQHISKVQPAM